MADPELNQLRLYSGAPPGVNAEGGFPCYLLPGDIKEPPFGREAFIEIGEGHLPITARVYMTQSGFDALPADFRTGSGKLGIQITGMAHDTFAPAAIVEKVINFAPEFFLVKADVVRASIDGESLLRLELATIQHWWRFKNPNLAFNMLSDDCLSYEARAKSASTPFNYQEIADAIGSDLGVSFGVVPRTVPMTTGSPHNLVLRFTPGGMGIARLLQPLGMHLVCDPYGVTLSFSIQRLLENVERNALEGLAEFAAYAGSGADSSDITPGNIMPAQIRVLFPLCPLPPLDQERYCQEVRANPFPGFIPGTEDELFVGDHNCVCDEDEKEYKDNEDLSAMATERATAYFNRANIKHDTFMFGGIHDFRVGSTIRKVRISMDLDGQFTTVWTHGMNPYRRADLESQHGGMKAPHFPEHGEPFGIEVDPRDDGVIDIRHPFSGECTPSPETPTSPESPETPGPSPGFPSDGIGEGDRPGDKDDCPDGFVLMPVAILDCDGSPTGQILCTCVKDCCGSPFSPDTESPGGADCTICVKNAGDLLANGIYTFDPGLFGEGGWKNERDYTINRISGTGFHFIRSPDLIDLYRSPIGNGIKNCPDINPYVQVLGASPPPEVTQNLSGCLCEKVCVSGAGREAANGIYTLDGDQWVNDNNYTINDVGGTGKHILRDEVDVELYESPLQTEGSDCPGDLGAWTILMGEAPAPAVTTDLSACEESPSPSPSPGACSDCSGTQPSADVSGIAGGEAFCENFNGTYTFDSFTADSGAGCCRWVWEGPDIFGDASFLHVEFCPSAGAFFARIFTTEPTWGGTDKTGGWKDVTGSVACSGGDLDGTFGLDPLKVLCTGETATVDLKP